MHVARHILRWVFERLYHEFAWAYDLVAATVSAGLWQRWGRVVLPYLRGRTLELGFGPGHLQYALATTNDPAVGVDASPSMVALARRRLQRGGYAPRITQALAQHLPFPSATFDTVFATFPADYIADTACHAEILRVLAPGGRVVIILMAHHDPGHGANRLHQRLSPPPLQIGDLVLTSAWVRVGPSQALLLLGETTHRPE